MGHGGGTHNMSNPITEVWETIWNGKSKARDAYERSLKEKDLIDQQKQTDILVEQAKSVGAVMAVALGGLFLLIIAWKI